MIKSISFLLFFFVDFFYVTQSCDGNHGVVEQDWEFRNIQQSDVYDPYRYVNIPYLIPYYYPTSSSIQTSDNYEARTPSASKLGFSNPFKHLQQTPKNEVIEDAAENRFFGKLSLASSLLSNTGLFQNMFGNNAAIGGSHHGLKPFSKVSKWLPSSNNLDLSNVLSKFDTCTAASQEEGICVPGVACSFFGGRPSGSCDVKNVCCINAVTSCGSTITLNNTYWQSPTTLPSSCSLTIKLDQTLLEQGQEIAQIRLDFMSFSIGQPNADGNCATDVFRVSGAENLVPEICGDNAGQHMYLDVPSTGMGMTSSSSREINLSFQLGAQSSASRMWNIKVSMLAAGSKYLAPQDCLQYYTSPTGRVRSFNWQDVGGTATRQLNNQNYNICFRTELINRQRANEMCLSVCPVKNGGDAFLLTTPTAATNPAAIAANAQAARDAAKLAAAQTALNSAQSALTTAQTTLTTAQNAVTAATPANMAELLAAVATAQSNLKLAQNNLVTAQNALLDAGIDATPEQAQAVIDARAAVTAAQTALTAAQAAANPPELVAAQSAFVTAQSSFNSAQSTFNSAQSSFNAAQSAFAASSSAAAAANAAASFSSSSGTTFTTTTTTFGRQEPPVDEKAGEVTYAICLYDYLLIDGGRDANNAVADRYCGNQMNPATGGSNSVQVCSPIKPFRITYHTDGTEGAVAAGTNILPATADTANTGFCLDFQER
ncbi:hypothetical protein OUZ56_019597 [Daphnia magna]|uniref:CUB domain-containing protein n=1 Tax=Daphnia magna TaxID=35525 RepID=A0ABQ9ZC19_9CRUS|nr:hypothetical protein OUZ56_019597 [Daphnia magna]